MLSIKPLGNLRNDVHGILRDIVSANRQTECLPSLTLMLPGTHLPCSNRAATSGRRIFIGAAAWLWLSSWLAAAGITFNFTLPSSYTTSAGVFETNGHLVKTLWRRVGYASGAHQASWDGTKDDGSTAPAGNYQIRLLYHNVGYVWEGTVGITASSFTGDIRRGLEPMTDLAADGTNLITAMGYNEGQAALQRFSSSDAQTLTSSLLVGAITLSLDYVATDGTWNYTATTGNGIDFGYNHTFVVAYKMADNTAAAFTNGTTVVQQPGYPQHTYASCIDVESGKANPASGLAVQKTGNTLAVSHGTLGIVRLFDKRGGQATGTITISTPGRLAFAPNGDLWVLSGTTANRFAAATLGTTNTAATTISGLSGPLAIGVHPSDNNTVLIADGGTSQQVKAYNSTGTALWTFGTAGGYATDASVSNAKLGFVSSRIFVTVLSDGSFWVADNRNFRALHYTSGRTYIEQIMYLPANYVAAACPTASLSATTQRVFGDSWLEFAVDFTKPLLPGDPVAAGGNASWNLVKNWSAGVPSQYLGNGVGDGINTVMTLSNGRTYGLVQNNSTNKMAVVELPSTGVLRFTGIEISKGTTLYANGDLRSASVANSVQTISKQSLTGFDGSGNPIWGTATVLASSSAGTGDPYYRGSFSGSRGPQFPITASNIVISFDQSVGTNANTGMHLGGVKVGATSWLWEASPAASTVNYADPAQQTGLFDIGDGTNYGGNCVQVIGQNIVYGYHGEFWSNAEANQFMHFWDDGLFVGEFGVANKNITGAQPGVAGNDFNPSLVLVNGQLYLWHNDENNHDAMHRWRLDGANAISEMYGTGTLNSTITLSPSLFQTENLTVAAQSTATHRVITDPAFSGGSGTILDATVVGDYITYLVPAVNAGTYDVRVGVKTLNTRGTWQLAIGRADSFNQTKSNVGTPKDEYTVLQTFTEYDLGTWSPGTTSDKWFQFLITGKNASSTGFSEAFDYIKLIPQ